MTDEAKNLKNSSETNKRMNILLVEDDPFLVDIYTTKLKEHNYIVKVSGDGQDSVNKITEMVPDLILLDIVLPKMDGIEVLRTIKANPKTMNAKVIVLSNLSQTYEVSKALEMGAVSYLIKSHYSPSEVVEEIKKYL
ncbi:MAG: response regulator [bacterium]